MSTFDSVIFASATEQAALLARGELGAVELAEAQLAQIERVNPKVNAVVTLAADTALEAARASDRRRARGESLGPLDGLTIGVKDLFMTRGVRTTYGSTIYADNVPEQDHLIVERERAAGLVMLGKTNTPEFGAGAQTFNALFGVTRNPYDLTRTCGGSSGGSAVALACAMVSLADGSDFGGSLRAPAAWCNVAGFRPSPGRVPSHPTRLPWSTLSVHGPMGRTVADVALLMQAIAGPDPRVPIAIEQPAEMFAGSLSRDFRGTRIAWSRDLGFLPVDPAVTAVCEASRHVFADLGCEVVETEPDMRGASAIFKTLRAAKFAIDRQHEMTHHRQLLKRTVVENALAGERLGGLDTWHAEAARARLWHAVREFMDDHEFMVWPVNPVPPFSADQETLTEIGGTRMDTYVDWGALRHVVSVVGLPSLSVPCGFTADGLPTGLQITGRHNRDLDVLRLGHAFERATEFWKRRPAIATTG
ncbi:MAG: amidase [Ectothiorhodospiraceae bacterium]|nr:amidase [Ectothiorhodospiraceae bacterium]